MAALSSTERASRAARLRLSRLGFERVADVVAHPSQVAVDGGARGVGVAGSERAQDRGMLVDHPVAVALHHRREPLAIGRQPPVVLDDHVHLEVRGKLAELPQTISGQLQLNPGPYGIQVGFFSISPQPEIQEASGGRRVIAEEPEARRVPVRDPEVGS